MRSKLENLAKNPRLALSNCDREGLLTSKHLFLSSSRKIHQPSPRRTATLPLLPPSPALQEGTGVTLPTWHIKTHSRERQTPEPEDVPHQETIVTYGGHGIWNSCLAKTSSLRNLYVSAQSCRILCNPISCGPPGSPVHGILQARILEWVAISSSRGSSQPRDQTHIACIGRRILSHCTTWEPWGRANLETNMEQGKVTYHVILLVVGLRLTPALYCYR